MIENQILWALKHLSEMHEDDVILYHKLVNTNSLPTAFCPTCRKKSKNNLIIVMSDWKTTFLDVRIADNKTSFPLSNIKDYQWDWSIEIVYLQGHMYFFLIHFKYSRCIYAVDALTLKRIASELKIKNIPIEVFNNDDRIVKIEKDNSSFWDLEPIICNELLCENLKRKRKR